MVDGVRGFRAVYRPSLDQHTSPRKDPILDAERTYKAHPFNNSNDDSEEHIAATIGYLYFHSHLGRGVCRCKRGLLDQHEPNGTR